MKKILLFILSLWCVSAMSQTTGYFRYDTVTFQKIGGTTEFNLRNATRGVTGGVLTNMGNGRTSFVTPTASTNIYNTDGTLTATRTVTGNSLRSLFFTDMRDFYITSIGGAGNEIEFQSASSRRFRINNAQTEIISPDGNNTFKVTDNQTYATALGTGHVYFTSNTHFYVFGKDSVNIGSGPNGPYPAAATTYANVYPHRIYLNSDSAVVVGAESSQDSYAGDSLIWRMTDRSSFFLLEPGVAEIYGGTAEIELENDDINADADSFRTIRTANIKAIADSAGWYMKIRNKVTGTEADAYWPAGGGSQTPWTSNIDGGGFNLSNAAKIGVGGAFTPLVGIENRTGNMWQWSTSVDAEILFGEGISGGQYALMNWNRASQEFRITNTAIALRIDESGRSSFGNVTPSAWVTAGAGTTTIPSVLLTEGAKTTTALDGAIEKDDAFYMTKTNAVRYGVGGTLNSQFTDVGNVGTGIDNLMSYTIPAGTLSQDGDFLEFTMSFQLAANANLKEIKIVFGAGEYTVYSATTASAVIIYKGTITRKTATSQVVSITGFSGSGTEYVDLTIQTETLSGAVVLKATGEATSNNDINMRQMAVKFFPAN